MEVSPILWFSFVLNQYETFWLLNIEYQSDFSFLLLNLFHYYYRYNINE